MRNVESIIRDLNTKIEEQAEEIRQLREDALAWGPLPPDVGRLTPSEERILRTLMRRDAVFPNGRLKTAIYGYGPEPSDADNIVRVMIHSIRKKLPPSLKIINDWGRGYRLEKAN